MVSDFDPQVTPEQNPFSVHLGFGASSQLSLTQLHAQHPDHMIRLL